jgi:prenyl protein peptidase
MVCLVSLLAPIPLLLLLPEEGGPSGLSRLQQLGLSATCYTSNPLLALFPLLLVMILFMGPLVEASMRGVLAGFSSWDLERDPLIVARTLLVAPLTEEWVFRCCCIPLLVFAGCSHSLTVALTCTLFGLVHAHHSWRPLLQGVPWRSIAAQVIFQCAYTSLFGGIMAHAYLLCGSFLGVAAAHTFANFMGFPSLRFGMDPMAVCYPVRWWIWGCYGVGIAGFAWALLGGGYQWLFKVVGAPVCALTRG